MSEEIIADGIIEEAAEDVISDEDLDEVTGGATTAKPGTRAFQTKKATQIFDTYLTSSRRLIRTLPRGYYLRYCKVTNVKPKNILWVNFGAFSNSKSGPWTTLVGWCEASNCTEL